MSCHTLREGITDVARGRDVGAGTVAAVESHIEHCEGCRAQFMRERRLSEGLRALAESTRELSAPAALESQLLEAFASHHADPAPRATIAADDKFWAVLTSRRRKTYTGATISRSREQAWMRAAAGILIAAGVLGAWLIASRARGNEAPRIAASPSTAPPVPVEQVPAVPSQAASAAAAATSQVADVTDARRSRVRAARPPRQSRIIQPEGFVALPSAAGLPAFESGEIVRVEVSVASLPLYGIEIVADERAAPVEADFLVAQDGRARAIRLVRSTSASSSSLK